MERITFAELSQVVAASGGSLIAYKGELRIMREGLPDLILEVDSEN